MTLKLILLDRNAVAKIKNCISGKFVPAADILKLRQLDKHDNLVSPILSVIEGQKGRRESRDELEITLKKESKAVGYFFRRARTDEDYFNKNVDSFTETFANHIEDSWDNYIAYICEAKALLYQSVASTKRRAIENQLIKLAGEYGVAITHPVFLATLSVLYGSLPMQKVLKPKPNYDSEEDKNRAAYNTVCDLMVVSRIGLIRTNMTDAEKRFGYVKYFTFDKGLDFFIKSIRFDSEIALAEGVEMKVTYNRKLFPDLDEENWARLGKLLGCFSKS